ncbi:MAG: hypothetical protein HC910_06080 [Spirulinaceae cyanobacterium SM2_1_0]|nr:hypothetical protein [Spirulinaceae cyanobacterium SM2_1_0]
MPAASHSASAAKNIYRFWSNQQVEAGAIRSSHRDEVVKPARAAEVVLAIQDTTDLNASQMAGSDDDRGG